MAADANITAVIQAVLDSKQFEEGVNKMTAKAKAGGEEQKDIAEGIKHAYELVGAFIGGELVKTFTDLVEGASEFTKANEKMSSVFAGNEQAAIKLRDELTDMYHLSIEDATKYLTTIQDTQLGLGLTATEATKFSGEAVKAAKTLEEFGKGSTQGNLDAIQAAFQGQVRALKTLGVTTDEATIANIALSKGFTLVDGAVSQVNREQIIMELVTKANAKAFAQMGKESKGLEESIQIAGAKFKDFKLAVGLELQDAIKGTGSSIAEFIGKIKFEDMELGVKKVIQIFKVLFDVAKIVYEGVLTFISVPLEIARSAIVMRDEFIKAGSKIVDAFNDVGDIFTELSKKIKGQSSDVSGAVGKFWKDTKSAGEDSLEAIYETGKTTVKGFIQNFTNLGTDIQAVFTENSIVNKDQLDKQVEDDKAATETRAKNALKAQEAIAALNEFILKAGKATRESELAEEEIKFTKLKKAAQDSGQASAKLLQDADKANTAARAEINDKYNKKQIDEAVKTAKQIVSVYQSFLGVLDNLAKISNLKQEKDYQDTLAKEKALDADYAKVTEQRAAEDYDSQKASLTQQIADAKAANDTKTANDLQRQLDRLNQDRDYTVKKGDLDKQAAEQDKTLKAQQWEQDHELKFLGAIASTAAGVAAGIAELPVPPFPFAIAAGALGAAQIALIAGQTPPAFAEGGTSKGGMALVGEKGPELVNLPAGANVYSADMTRKILGNLPVPNGGSSTQNFSSSKTQKTDSRQYNFNAHGVTDPVKFLNGVKRELGDRVFQGAS